MKALPVNPTDPAVTGPDIFAKLVPMAAHEASSLYRCVPGCGAGGHGSCRSRTASWSRSSGCRSQQGARALAQQLCKLKRAGSWRFPWGATNVPESFWPLSSVSPGSWSWPCHPKGPDPAGPGMDEAPASSRRAQSTCDLWWFPYSCHSTKGLFFFSALLQRGEGQTAERCDGEDRSQERSAGVRVRHTQTGHWPISPRWRCRQCSGLPAAWCRAVPFIPSLSFPPQRQREHKTSLICHPRAEYGQVPVCPALGQTLSPSRFWSQ